MSSTALLVRFAERRNLAEGHGRTSRREFH